MIRYAKRYVTFTEKTRYLFEINKDARPEDSRTMPHLVNNKPVTRRVPFQHMIYVGDGLTEIPCFPLVRKEGGRTFGVFSRNKKSAKQAFLELLQERRVDSLHSPDYREAADLGSLIRAAVSSLAADYRSGFRTGPLGWPKVPERRVDRQLSRRANWPPGVSVFCFAWTTRQESSRRGFTPSPTDRLFS